MLGRIDPESGELLDIDRDQPRSLAELRRITPPCPRCGTPISVIPIPLEGQEGPAPTPLYAFGRHEFHCRCY